jgi:hypothetical protein
MRISSPIAWRGRLLGAGLTILVWNFCSLLAFAADANTDYQEMKLLLDQIRKENNELRQKQKTTEKELIVATNRLAKIEKTQGDVRSGLVADDEEARSASEWRAFLSNSLKLLSDADREIKESQKRLRLLLFASEKAFQTAQEVDPVKRAMLEQELRSSRKFLSETVEEATTPIISETDKSGLAAVKLIGVRLDLGVAALGIGRKQGAKVGMPFLVIKDKKLLAMLVIAEVRDKTALALIEQMDPDYPIKEGDLATLKRG